MKVQATVVFKFQASSLAEAGSVLDDVLSRAHEAVSAPGEYPPGVPRPGSTDGD